MHMDRRQYARRLFLSTAAAVAACGIAPRLAQANATVYPARPVTIIVPFAPGGGTDIVARLLAANLAQAWNVSVVVDNKPGAGGQIGTSFVARAAPDGYTLLLGITTLIQAPSLYQNLPYDAFKDLTPLAQLATSVNFLVVPSTSPVNTFKDFVAQAKSRRGKMNFGSNGNAGTSHLHGALLNATLDLDMVHVPYAGSAPLITALLGQQIDCAFVDIAPLRPQLQSGKLRPIAVTGPTRSPAFPDVPTLAELGVSGFEPVGWFSLFGPAGLPEQIRTAISDATMQAMRSADIVKRIEDLGLLPSQLTQPAFAESMHADLPKWQKMVQMGNIRVD